MHFRPLHFLFFAIAFVTVKLSANGDIDCILDLSLIEKGHRTYYAHPLSSYNKGTEQRDIALLKSLEMTVVNPNSYKVEKLFRKTGDFSIFTCLAASCDSVAVRAFRDGKLGAGVAKEALVAMDAHKMVFEIRKDLKGRITLFTLSRPEIEARALTIAETIAYLDKYGVTPRIKYK